MWFARIEAISVGPLADQHLDLVPGLNIIHGPNEAGKSSWHAALIAGWLGQRRGRGRREADHAFRARFEPWSGAPLIAAVDVETDDGARFRIRHNLTDLADHSVTDGSGNDVTSEWEHDGTADGAILLGLERDAANATLSVSQAQIMAVSDHAAGLQQYLQRAAANAGRVSATATEAIDRIERFLSEHVGTPRAPTRPLARSLKRRDEAATALAEAKRAHDDYLRLVAAHDAAITELSSVEQQRDVAVAELRAVALRHARQEFGELRQLADEIAAQRSGRPPADPQLVAEVAQLLQRLNDLPEPVDMARLERAIDALKAPDDSRDRSASAGGRGRRRIAAGVVVGSAAIAVGLLVAGVAPWIAGATVAAVALVAAVAWKAVRTSDRQHRSGAVAGNEDQLELLSEQLAAARQQTLRRATLESQVVDAAVQLVDEDLAGLETHRAAEALHDWLAEQTRLADRQQRVQVLSATLEARLAGRTLAEIEARLADTDPSREVMLTEPVGGLAGGHEMSGDLAALRRTVQQHAVAVDTHRRRVETAAWEIDHLARRITPVAEAEEALARAQADVDRLQGIADVLATARDHLERATQRVNQDLAPVLEGSVNRHLPTITAGRYRQVRVNPGRLQITVRGPDGRDRPAERLSLGTAEQMYLLLRIGLAEHLVTTGETAPLLLDDVTVQFDELRTSSFLDVCLELAAHRQIVVWSQRRDVAEWAEVHCDGPRHQLIRLPAPA